jgi:hypothetical protein
MRRAGNRHRDGEAAMSENRTGWLRWAIVMVLVYLSALIVGGFLAPVVPWVMTCVLQICGFLHVPTRALMIIALGGIFTDIVIEFAVVGFSYCWLMGDRWPKAGLSAWLVVVLIDQLTLIPHFDPESYRGLGASPLFYAKTAVACLAALAGARFAAENRYHPKLRDARQFIFYNLILEK